MIEAEDVRTPLTDDQIADRLANEGPEARRGARLPSTATR
jgi:DNA-directed RNA polymerase specialized sigma54-like protein